MILCFLFCFVLGERLCDSLTGKNKFSEKEATSKCLPWGKMAKRPTEHHHTRLEEFETTKSLVNFSLFAASSVKPLSRRNSNIAPPLQTAIEVSESREAE